MITIEQFTAAIGGLLEVLPMQRRLSEGAIVMLWETLPLAAKQDLTTGMLGYAVGQRLLDPEPPREVALHIGLLRYLYPLEHNRPATERGLRPDLRQRMQAPDRFHDPRPVREEQAAAETRAPRLPGGGRPWHPSQMTPEQRREHVLRVAATARRLAAAGPDNRSWNAAQLQQGLWWFQRALAGFWLLEVDAGGIAAAWLTRNPEWAERLIAEALAADVPQLPPAEGLAVDFIGRAA